MMILSLILLKFMEKLYGNFNDHEILNLFLTPLESFLNVRDQGIKKRHPTFYFNGKGNYKAMP